MSSEKISDATKRKLNHRRDWPKWYLALRVEARSKAVWELLDPDADDKKSPSDPSKFIDAIPSVDDYVKKRNTAQDLAYNEALTDYKRRLEEYAQQQAQADAPDDPDDPQEPEEEVENEPIEQPTIPTKPKVVTAHQARLVEEYTGYIQQLVSKTVSRTRKERSYESMDKWMSDTVAPEILENAKEELIDTDDCSLRAIIRVLKRKYAPSDSSSLTIAREEFTAVMSRANSNVNPSTWIKDFNSVYRRAVQLNLPEVQGTLASKAFLYATARRFAPAWSNQELTDIVKMERKGETVPDMGQYAEIFDDLLHEEAIYGRSRSRNPKLPL
ncbi:hypothetical protein BDP81DRAFT_455074 [Colletotrichum phormii]|uniref:Uncharacterized protein n=1 Tax=Colletotrichum phormii TaxID=359342 RepID=A0AAJ0E9G7_9PEZI|nr:uncharacterized protein BDP81DRAFT_455074 [Colletotrichum phormii]KAK1622770.1 hypothetical protein BDP81DRAFT_455074 [Colletotrichum phormii]